MTLRSRFAAVIAGLWAGVLLCIASIATPAPFAMLPMADAGRVVGRIFEQEAYLSLGVAMLLVFFDRAGRRETVIFKSGSVFGTNLMLIFGALFCTVAGYFAVQPMMAAARAGQGALSFGALHAISLGFFALKGLLVLALAWRLVGSAR